MFRGQSRARKGERWVDLESGIRERLFDKGRQICAGGERVRRANKELQTGRKEAAEMFTASNLLLRSAFSIISTRTMKIKIIYLKRINTPRSVLTCPDSKNQFGQTVVLLGFTLIPVSPP